MKPRELFTSPPPATGWSLDAEMAAVVRRHSKGELGCAAVEVPEGTFEVGPVGLQAVDQGRLRPLLTRLQGEVSGSRRAALVVPTGWLRSHLLEFDQLPRRASDVHDVVLWRLKKLLPVPPASLRLAMVSQPSSSGSRRLLVLVGVERAIAGVEAAFDSVGVSLGFLTPRVFAAADSVGAGGPVLTIQQEPGFLALLLRVADAPVLVRTKPLARDEWQVVETELGLTVGFIRSTLEVREPLTVELSMSNAGLADRLRTWIGLADDLQAAPPGEQPFAFDGSAVRQRVGGYRLDPVLNLMAGRVR